MTWLIILAILIAGVAIAGVVYEATSAARDRATYKKQTPPGQLIDVGGHKLHAVITGERTDNEPAVILESTVGANALDWQKVQPLLTENNLVVSYDRAGYGFSEAGPEPRTPERLAQELHTLLKNADIAPPYILAGHRYGGLFVRKFAELYPDDVAGVLLVDSSHPQAVNELNDPSEIRRLENNVRIFQPLGLVRFVTRRNYRAQFLMEDERAEYVAFMMFDNKAMIPEVRPIFEDGIHLSDKLDKPLVVLSREEDDILAREREWAEKQRDLLTLSDNAEHLHAESSNSWMVFAEPEAIAKGVQQLKGML
ncbi:MAG: alpha/beta hydrolase [Chloroflexota bacterium]